MTDTRRVVVGALAAVLIAALAQPGAHAVGSLGASVDCDHDNHCVEGTATSSNAAVNVSVSESSVGTAVAVCKGVGAGATLLEITCRIGNNSSTMSFPGSAGSVPLVTSTGTLDRLPVCWDVVGYFPVITGPQHVVPTGDCALLSL